MSETQRTSLLSVVPPQRVMPTNLDTGSGELNALAPETITMLSPDVCSAWRLVPAEGRRQGTTAYVDFFDVVERMANTFRAVLAVQNPHLQGLIDSLQALSVAYEAEKQRLDRIEAGQKHVEKLLEKLVQERKSVRSTLTSGMVSTRDILEAMPELAAISPEEERKAAEEIDPDVLAKVMAEEYPE